LAALLDDSVPDEAARVAVWGAAKNAAAEEVAVAERDAGREMREMQAELDHLDRMATERSWPGW
jgi:hypothetical protein